MDESPTGVELPKGRRRLDAATASVAEICNLALAVLTTWGPTLGSPVEPRVQALVTGLDDAAAQDAVRAARAAEYTGHRFVDAAGVSGAEFEPPRQKDMDAEVLADHPWVDDANLGTIYNQGCYFAWHG